MKFTQMDGISHLPHGSAWQREKLLAFQSQIFPGFYEGVENYGFPNHGRAISKGDKKGCQHLSHVHF